MAKAPLANEAEASRTDRRTRIASGPGPLPPPPAPLGAPVVPAHAAAQAKAGADAAKAALRKTQISMGAPPIPGPAITGKTMLPTTGPAVPKPGSAPKLPATPVPDASLPSYQETVIGPAPAPPVPRPPSPVAAKGADTVVDTRTHAIHGDDDELDIDVDPSESRIASQIDPSDSQMDALLSDSLFEDEESDFEQEFRTALHGASADATLPAPSRARSSTDPAPSRTSGPNPAYDSGTRDTLPNPDLHGGSGKPGMGTADTQVDLADNKSTNRPRTGVRSVPQRSDELVTLPQGTDAHSAPVAEVPKIRLVAGKVIPGTRYEIRRWLGEGGMGVVYEVVHTDLDRRSALKILRFDLSQQSAMAQVFRDEARAVSRLGSPNIVEVYDFGELADGRLFFAMELLEGEDLVPANEQTSMEPGRLLGILRQVCKGLARAHEAGVVHRDVKPENVIITTVEGRADHVKIVDFGISAMLAAGGQRNVGIAGTPHYMAPEQILGEEFDGRLDVYALGCTAYELLVGRPPFDDEDIEKVLQLQLHETPTPVRQVRPDLPIPAELEAVIMRCLAKSPAERYRDMADLEAALCEAQIAAGLVTPWDDLPIPQLPDEERRQRIIAGMPSHRPLMPARRMWLWPAIAFTSTLAAAGLAAFLVFGRQPTAEEKDLVEQLTNEAREAASKASWVVPPSHLKDNPTALRKVAELEALEGRAHSMADDRAEELRHEFATTLVTNGNQLWEGAPDFARQYYAWSLMFESNDEIFGRANIDPLTFEMAKQRALAGEFNDAEMLVSALTTYESAQDPEQKAKLEVAITQGLAATETMSPIARMQLERHAKSTGVEVTAPTRGSGAAADTAGDAAGDGGTATADGSDAAAADGGDDALILDENGEPIDDGGEAGDAGDDAGTDDNRKKRRRQVDLGLSSKKGKNDPARSNELVKEGDAKRKQGLRGEAKSLYGQAIAANPGNGDAHLGMALVHFDQSSYHQARKSAEQAVKLSPRNGRAHKALGDALFKEFHYQEAEAAYIEAQRLGVNVGNRLTEVRKKLGK
ncbi:protein kinase domain-containing protein [Paraliomyxa miuraensis]|uniref:serine/threonine-protein kinase n=1 Tax=Paraliomyxa miuraensis TaxID=376150 RepID=UPI00225C4107|nr:serine/threonine-protein kinase [Paraliomyxa miuraensis]MCX4242624.1 protein kinase [Paraliomyxa miuraensis]